MIEFTSKDVLLITFGIIATIAFVGLVFRKDDKIEGRRKEAIKIAHFLRQEVGLELMPRFFDDYAVGDYSGMWAEAKGALNTLDSPTLRAATLAKCFDVMLENRLKLSVDEAKRIAAIVAKVLPTPPPPPAPVTQPAPASTAVAAAA